MDDKTIEQLSSIPQTMALSHEGQERTENSETTWLYVRIYCRNEDADDVLLHLIHPLARQLLEQKYIYSYFFIRFFEGGHHFRVRFQGEKSVLLGSVQENLNRATETYFIQRGCTVQAPLDQGPDGMEDQQWQPAYIVNAPRLLPSYEYDRYEPEAERYGGPWGLAVSERHFMDASEFACAIIERERQGDGSRRNAALIFLYTLAESFGIPDYQKIASFEGQYRYWLSAGWCTEDHLALFESEYKRQQRALQWLVPLHSHGSCHKSREVWLSLAEQWQEATSKTVHTLTRLRAQNQLAVQPIELLFSYIHLFCNRLKLFPREEAYLAYLLYRTCAQQDGINDSDFHSDQLSPQRHDAIAR